MNPLPRRRAVGPLLWRRSVLAGYLPGSPHPRSLAFGRNMHGKPALVGPRTTAGGHRLRFNLTHTGDMIGLAVTGGWPAQLLPPPPRHAKGRCL